MSQAEKDALIREFAPELNNILQEAVNVFLAHCLVVQRISMTDLRDTASFSDFIVNIGFEGGFKATVNGMLDNKSDLFWLNVKVGDLVSFTHSGHSKEDVYVPPPTATGSTVEIISHQLFKCVLLNVIKGTAHELHSQAVEPEGGWDSVLKQPKAKEDTRIRPRDTGEPGKEVKPGDENYFEDQQEDKDQSAE